MTTRILFCLAILGPSLLAAPPTVGQWELRKKESGGMVSHGITWADGQVILLDTGVPEAITLDKTAVGLNNVENIAISTYGGSTNWTTVGTITTGTWNATAIALGNIAQGGATSGQALTWNGSAWAPTTISSGITIGSTAITGGTSGRLLTSGSTVGELTLGSGVATLLGSFTATNANDALSGDDFVFTGTANVLTDVLTAKSLKLNSSDGVYLRDGYEATGDANQKGRLVWGNDAYGVSVQLNGSIVSLAKLLAGNGLGSPYYAGELVMPASHQWDIRSGTNAVSVNFFNTYTSGSNYEAASIFWSGNVAHYKPVAGGGGGTVRTQRFWLTGTVWIGSGSGTPEAVETAGVGSIYTDTATGNVYRKTSGAGNTGWVTP